MGVIQSVGVPIGGFNWTYLLLISTFLSLIVGSTVGLVQFRIKKLLAYSTISHVGFLLLALTINSIESTQAFIFYLMQYSLISVNIFFILVAIGSSLSTMGNNNDKFILLDSQHSPIQYIGQLKGLFYLNPVMALSFAFSIFSLLGIPPTVGFFAKQLVLSAALQDGLYFITLIAILTSVVGGVYYLLIIKAMFFEKCDSTGNKNSHSIRLSSSLTLPISALTLISSFFIFYPQGLLSIANILALILSYT
jgi:NADH-ubiquinone oxidoreductase chain 2